MGGLQGLVEVTWGCVRQECHPEPGVNSHPSSPCVLQVFPQMGDRDRGAAETSLEELCDRPYLECHRAEK